LLSALVVKTPPTQAELPAVEGTAQEGAIRQATEWIVIRGS
jgi:hypothetical protein